MKINRLLEITIILLNRGNITAKELSERFEVSVRTIYRDIDILSSSGVPVYSSRGKNGGIQLMENYSINKTILSDEESESILFALKTLKLTRYPHIDDVLYKLGAIFKNSNTDWIEVDFSPWDSNSDEKNKFECIKLSIVESKMIEFDYVNAENVKGHRYLKPLKLIFKSISWYIFGFDTVKLDYRIFRISRMKNICLINKKFNIDKNFELKDIPIISSSNSNIELELKFNNKSLSRLYDEFNDKSISENEDNTYTVKFQMPENEWLYNYILSFGDSAEVISPKHIRDIIIKRIENMHNIYDTKI